MSETNDDIPAVLDAPTPQVVPGANDFVPFAGSPAAEVMPLAQYVDPSFTTRQVGFQTGVAQNVELNRVWRQASIISSMIGQFIASETGQHAVDDGTDNGLATLLAQFQAAITTILGGGNLTQAQADLLYLKLTGGTLSGPLTIQGAAGLMRQIVSQTNVAGTLRNRWITALADNSGETGGNAGSDWTLTRYDDAGNPIDIVMRCHRDTGVVEFPNGIIGGTGAGQVQPPLGGWANGQLIPYGGGQFEMFLSSATFIVPPLVNSIRCRVVGAGGTGSGGGGGAGGGGGGEYAHGNFNVTPGAAYAVTVGQGTTSVGALISALPGANSTALPGGAGGAGGTGGNVRFAGGPGGTGVGGGGGTAFYGGGGAAGSVLGVGGGGGSAGGGVGGGSGGAVGGKVGAVHALNSSACGGASPFSPGVAPANGQPSTAANGAPDAVGISALAITGANAVGRAGTKSAGPTQPRYWGETLTGGGGGGAVDATGVTPTVGGNGGDGAGGGCGANTTGGTQGGNGGIFGGGAGGTAGAGGGIGGPGGGSGGNSNAVHSNGWCVIEW